MLPTILFCLLVEVPATYAVAGSSRHHGLAPHGLGRLFHAPARRHIAHADIVKLVSRQSSPPFTTDPDCTLYDGYFYVTPRNYTWQLQCSNTYDGVILAQTTDITDLVSCIEECVNYNRLNTPGACLAVTFNGAYATADTVCTQFSDVTSVGIASEEGGFENSALLILGPNSEIFATPQPEPSFSGAPSQPPTADPVPPSTTTTSAATTTTSTLLLTSNSQTVSTSYAIFTTTTTSYSTVLVTSCPAGSASCQQSTTLIPFPSTDGPGTSASSLQTTNASFINITDGGSRPATSRTTTLSSNASGAFTFDAGQTTFTTIIPFTEYRLQIIEVCTATPTPCSQSTSTTTRVGLRTQISCSPGPCIGVAPATGFMVDALATGACIVP
ncbi:uncharacterized protein Z519_08983 [Cladophialophora bantiana CBS 173.52]|uniref:Apple domain-containing protein n=1 Tax=Cladophialophora bantiana (strain ATCC 10958 / CBS 173.52 / CDC B-1940 / NIH 8579) TaxID=1442370 RepID=A0A0D2I0E6_CLAB1|nr:uncharacterized protein Z519_08983 [Cladophialophora bantiana CBS 173.52]KIW90339.1 hypothetical protein Z519_08983 [Cladophialophora bantiana CBS 173.52]